MSEETADDNAKLYFQRMLNAPTQIMLSTENEKKTPFSDMYTSRVVFVKVSDKEYTIHSSLLCQESEYFRTALLSSFKVAQELVVSLPNERSAVFDPFVKYLYKGRLDKSSLLMWYVATYALGERLMAPGFQKQSLELFDETLKIEHARCPADSIQLMLTLAWRSITTRSPKDDPMRERVLELAAANLTKLRNDKEFIASIEKDPELTKELLLRAGNTPLLISEDSVNRSEKICRPVVKKKTDRSSSLMR